MLARQTQTNQDEIKELNTKLSLVSLTSDGYLSIRNRFFAVLRRDLLGEISTADRQAITRGNLFSHAGDALADALLFEKTIRSDMHSYLLLYGFSPQVVMNILSLFFRALVICYN